MDGGRGETNRWRRACAVAAGCILALSAPAVPARPAPHPAAHPAGERGLEAQLLEDITTLASDDFAGREPGTDGEAKTLRWLGRQWFDAGLVSGTNDPGHPWFAPVALVAREPVGSALQFWRHGRQVLVEPGTALVLTSGRRSLLEGAPLLFVGHAQGDHGVPPRAELAGRIAVLLDSPAPDGDPRVVAAGSRQDALLAGGAAGVLTVLDGPRSLEGVAARRKRSGYALAGEALGGDLEGFITSAAMDRVLASLAASVRALEAEADRPAFQPRPLDLNASMEATTRETAIRTHNLIGRLPGRHPEAGAVLLLAHWDHFGTCAQPPAEHLICNGAIDNASGVAALTEVARRLSKAPPPERDIYFLATTAEELGLLGAEAFAENPPLPLERIVAAFNLDSVAIAPHGTPLGIVGKGLTRLDPAIAEVAREQHRRLVDGAGANAWLHRQDGWALIQHDVPAVMVSSAYGDLPRLEAFFDRDYHRPGDVVKPGLELGGMADDVQFHVALARWFADPKKYAGPGREAGR
jgi:hypothetical protein